VSSDEAVAKLKAAFAASGFEVRAEIDMQAIPQVGVLLPRNVVVRESDQVVLVEAVDRGLISAFLDAEPIKRITEEARSSEHGARSTMRLSISSHTSEPRER
jgi:uncharacterized protein (DUF302 family)